MAVEVEFKAERRVFERKDNSMWMDTII